jgi:hypothetical protein
MKRTPLILIGVAALLLITAAWTPDLLAAVRSTDAAPAASDARVEYPLNRDCVVTVDPRAFSQAETAGQANKTTGFVAPDTVAGTLVRLDSEWLVLRDGRHDNWIPMDKVLMVHVAR